MARSDSDAGVRLQQAAMELFGEHGFDRTTVADIAARARLTERTFFRYFADKREVPFRGSARLEELLVAAAIAIPEATAPTNAVGAALEAVAPTLERRRDAVSQHHHLLLAHAERCAHEARGPHDLVEPHSPLLHVLLGQVAVAK